MAKAHEALQRRLADCYAGRVVSDPREHPYYRKILGLDGGPWRETANYQAMLVASWLWRVTLADVTAEERRLAHRQVAKLLELEYGQGMYRSECLCPDPHAGVHLEAHLALLCALRRADLRELAFLSYAWLARALRLYHDLASPDGEPWLPGLRVRTKIPRNQAAAALLRQVLGLPHRRENGKMVSARELATPGTSRGPDYYGALRWLLRLFRETPELRLDLRELATIGPCPDTLLLPLEVTRFEGGLLAVLEKPATTPPNGWLDPVDWLLVHWGKPGRHQVEVGRNWQTPPPAPPHDARVLEQLTIPEEGRAFGEALALAMSREEDAAEPGDAS